ncbi:MAG TPA: cyclase family protein [Bryobacteraceae bacterium]|jgi:kynurenine formamidase|nr:cyclase family protein [Bryobacteraceae bacterium]
MSDLWQLPLFAKIYDLSQPLYIGMPHFPTHPPYLFSLNKQHGDYVMKNGASSASETITLGGHVGTHIDALNHFSCAGRLYGGEEVRQSPVGVEPHSVDSIAPILRRAVLLDVASVYGNSPLPDDFVIAPEDLDRALDAAAAEIRPGDIALIRTGWAQFWQDQRRYTTAGKGAHVAGPGPEEPGARWLSERKVFAAGSDTLAFERVPSATMPAHVHLLVESGIHIIENLNLEELARDAVREFLFLAAPLRFQGGTGSPIRPIALVYGNPATAASSASNDPAKK